MPAIITNKFRIHNSEQFHESFTEAAGNTYYLGIGRPHPFTTTTRPDGRTENLGTDTAPITPVDAIAEEAYIYDELLAAKKIGASDISFVVPRRNWTTGTTYDVYRHDYGRRETGGTSLITSNSGATTLYDATFYVKTSANRVYKCLDNNGNAASTEEPTTTSTATQSTSDGYKWKLMYTLTASQQSNFLSTDFMAVETDSTVNGDAVDGKIDICLVKAAGTGGTAGTHTNIPIRGDGSAGKVSVTISAGTITDISVTTPGTDYTIGYITVADINAAGGGSLINAEIDVIIGPKGGHGFNAVEELGGFFVMLNQSLDGTELANSGDYTAENDFRKIVLFRDPTSAGSAATATTMRATTAVHFASSPTPGTFVADENITQTGTGATGKVVEWDSANRILYFIQTRFASEGADANGDNTSFSGAGVITGSTSTATGTPSTSTTGTINQVSITSGYSASEFDHDSGDVMYVENRAPIVRAADQTENIKLIIEF
jgi:hypothetical protein